MERVGFASADDDRSLAVWHRINNNNGQIYLLALRKKKKKKAKKNWSQSLFGSFHIWLIPAHDCGVESGGRYERLGIMQPFWSQSLPRGPLMSRLLCAKTVCETAQNPPPPWKTSVKKHQKPHWDASLWPNKNSSQGDFLPAFKRRPPSPLLCTT